MAIVFAEMPGSPTETWDSEGQFTATMKLIVDWDNRYELMARFVNFETPYPHLTEQFGHRQHGVLCRSVSASPMQAAKLTGRTFTNLADRRAAYEKAIVTVKFGTLRSGEGERIVTTANDPRGRGDIISESIEYNIEMFRLDPTLFRWASDNTPLTQDEAPSKQIVGFDYVFRRHNSLKINPLAKDLPGYVNDAPIKGMTPLLRGFIFDTETLLYIKPSFNRSVASDGHQQIDQVFRFAYRSAGWNRFWRGDINSPNQSGDGFLSEKGGWDRMITAVLQTDLTIKKDPYNSYPLGPIGDL